MCKVQALAHGGQGEIDREPNDEGAAKAIKQRKRDGWEHIGNTPDDKFLQFRIATDKVEESE